jgi:hypothetical protein
MALGDGRAYIRRDPMTMRSDIGNRLAARFIAGLSKASLDYGRRCEYRDGYPGASEAEIDLLVNAEKKNGFPPWSLLHAREILDRDNIYAFVPCCTSPFGRRPRLQWCPPHPSAAVKAEAHAAYLEAMRKVETGENWLPKD